MKIPILCMYLQRSLELIRVLFA